MAPPTALGAIHDEHLSEAQTTFALILRDAGTRSVFEARVFDDICAVVTELARR
jgi:hypothetical protein